MLQCINFISSFDILRTSTHLDALISYLWWRLHPIISLRLDQQNPKIKGEAIVHDRLAHFIIGSCTHLLQLSCVTNFLRGFNKWATTILVVLRIHSLQQKCISTIVNMFLACIFFKHVFHESLCSNPMLETKRTFGFTIPTHHRTPLSLLAQNKNLLKDCAMCHTMVGMLMWHES